MRIKNIKSLITACSAVMLIGLGLFSFDSKPSKPVVGVEIPDPTPVNPNEHLVIIPNGTKKPTPSPTNTSVPVTKAPDATPTSTPTPTPTSTPTPTPTNTPTPTPTPSLGELNAELPLRKATNDIGLQITAGVTDFLHTRYADDDTIKEITNVTCYYKGGITSDYIVYATYDIHYENCVVPLSEITVLFAVQDGTTYRITDTPADADEMDSVFLSRAKGDVLQLYVETTIRRYANIKLIACEDEFADWATELFSEIVTDINYIDIDDIQKKNEFISEYCNIEYPIYGTTPRDINEFDCYVYVMLDVRILDYDTLAPSVERFFIKLDENNYPQIFFGQISEDATLFIKSIQQSDDYELLLNNLNDRYLVAMQDPQLLKFIERLNGATE